MEQNKLSGSPIVYNISGREHDEWVLFLHAAFVTHEMFREQEEYFKDRYNILSLDIIGHGKSADAERGDSINKMSDWIHDVMLHEKIKKLHLVGVSLGSVIAQDFANHYPECVTSLTCFGGYDINNFNSSMQKENGSRQMLMMLKAIFSMKAFAKANKKISAYTAKAQEEFYRLNITFPKKSFMYLSTLNGIVNKHKTGKRAYPLLIGCGEHDIPMEKEIIKLWKESEPECKSVIIKNAGHCANMDNPEQFNKTLEAFWNNKL